MSSPIPDEQNWLRMHEICGVSENNCRPISAEIGEALLIAAEDIARLILQTEWSLADQKQMRDLALHTLDIINSISAPRADR